MGKCLTSESNILAGRELLSIEESVGVALSLVSVRTGQLLSHGGRKLARG